MFGKTKQSLIIVCDEKTQAYANYLRQLISTNDDKGEEIVGIPDGSVDVSVWLEKEYSDNKAKVSSNEHVLFIGNGKVSKTETSSMIVKFDKFGMKYGWLGKRGMMVVDSEILEPETYDQFIEYCLGYETEFEKIEMIQSEKRLFQRKVRRKTRKRLLKLKTKKKYWRKKMITAEIKYFRRLLSC